ncbi:RcnB family protein [Terricaulis sp.]|uniref:RcnB family protein n=1 Tax=Terricaulis sp. TaxID=2768686 RepID=UPI0037834BAA
MKRFATAALAVATMIAPLGFTGTASADPPRRHGNDHDGWDRDHDGRDRDWGRDHRRDGRWDRRHDRRERWERSRHNGYTYRGRWYYGPPPVAYYNDPYYSPGYRSWRRGDRLPSYYRSHYREVDWRRHGYRAPPRGYHYVRDDRGETLLVGIATGVILGVILANN